MATHLDTTGAPGSLSRTGVLVPFLDINIGQPFWAHGKVWVRTSYDSASALGSTSQRRNGFIYLGNCCNFNIDPIDLEVEALEYSISQEPWKVPPEVRGGFSGAR